MTAGVATFICSICGEPSADICVLCTKDSCHNHRCQRCKRCVDCCECEVPLSEEEQTPSEAAAEPEIHDVPMQVTESAAVAESAGVPEVAPPEPLSTPEEPGYEH